jgi:basic membrane protein A
MKKRFSLPWFCVGLIVSVILAICWFAVFKFNRKTDVTDDKARFSLAMVTDAGGINDRSFNTSSWQGMREFAERTNSGIRYVESIQSSDYFTNIDKLGDENVDLIFGIGFTFSDAILRASEVNPELHYAIVDFSYGDSTPDNVTGLVFRSEESSFLAGYVAGMTSKKHMVGFVGGMSGIVIDQFEYGYKAGVDYAAKERGTHIDVKVQYAESFSDSAKGKAIALKMFSEGCDIVFHAAGCAGVGVIEAAKETGCFAIGVDMDQSYLAPKNVLTSAMKNVGKAVDMIATDMMNGKTIGGKTFSYGLSEECVGLPLKHTNYDGKVYSDALKLQEKITSGEIHVPKDSASYKQYTYELETLGIY